MKADEFGVILIYKVFRDIYANKDSSDLLLFIIVISCHVPSSLRHYGCEFDAIIQSIMRVSHIFLKCHVPHFSAVFSANAILYKYVAILSTFSAIFITHVALFCYFHNI